MWVHWPKCLKILFLSKRYLISFLISYRLFVVFNNANAVSAEMWVWGFGNHAWNKSLLSSHSSATRDLTRLLYHLWFPKPHTHISYSQHLHNVEQKRWSNYWKPVDTEENTSLYLYSVKRNPMIPLLSSQGEPKHF